MNGQKQTLAVPKIKIIKVIGDTVVIEIDNTVLKQLIEDGILAR
jgi:hypothetical protein